MKSSLLGTVVLWHQLIRAFNKTPDKTPMFPSVSLTKSVVYSTRYYIEDGDTVARASKCSRTGELILAMNPGEVDTVDPTTQAVPAEETIRTSKMIQ